MIKASGSLRQLLPFYGGQHHLCLTPAIAALAVQKGRTSIQLLTHRLDDLLIPGRNDQRNLGIVKSVDHRVHHTAADKHRHTAVESLGNVPENNTCQHHHRHVEAHADDADGHMLILGLQKPHYDIRAAGGAARRKHDTQANTAEDPAVERRYQRIYLDGWEHSKQVDSHRDRRRAHHGTNHELSVDPQSADDQQRQID